jgi:hypothetical protein
VAVQVDVLHAQREGFLQPEARSVEELAEKTEGAVEVFEQDLHLAPGEHVGQVIGTPRAVESVERGHLDLEHLAVEEDQRAERLVLRRRRGPAAGGEVVEERRDFRGAHLTGMSSLVKADELAHPVEVGLLGARGVVQSSDGRGHGFEQSHGRSPGRASKGAASGGLGHGCAEVARLAKISGRGVVRELGRGVVRELGRGGLTPQFGEYLGSRGGLSPRFGEYVLGSRPTTMLDRVASAP